MNIEQSQGKQLQAETNCAETKVQGTAYKQFNAKKININTSAVICARKK